MTDVLTDVTTDLQAPDRQAYLTASDIKALLAKWTDEELLRLWRHFNVKAEWCPTIKYPPNFTEKLLLNTRVRLTDDTYVDDVVSWAMRSSKIWAREALGRFIVRLAFAATMNYLICQEGAINGMRQADDTRTGTAGLDGNENVALPSRARSESTSQPAVTPAKTGKAKQ